MLNRNFYLEDTNKVASHLLGKRLVHETADGTTSGIIVEVESYIGPLDKGSHAYNGKRTERTEIMYGVGGFSYVYAIYGIYSCFNVVTGRKNMPETVFIRALQPEKGIDIMKRRRKTQDILSLCSGPGKLCQAMGIDKKLTGYDLCAPPLYIESCLDIQNSEISVSPRINIDYAGEYKDKLWRYFIKDNPFVSKVSLKYQNLSCS